jgi:LCP family protein required for cell wall assembly
MWCIYAQGHSDYRGHVLTDGKFSRFAGTPRWMIIVSVSLVMTLAGALGIVRASHAQLDKVNRIDSVSAVLSPATPGIVNYLLVGSDSRASADPSDPDYATVGSEDENPGNRSDTTIVVRYDTKTKEVAMMSIPRDLWVRIGDGDRYAKVNSAYQKGPDVLVRTVQRALNIPIHHYVDINFAGFKQIVDAIGGVHICVPRASRDTFTGFYIGRKACKLQTGAQALGYARSRHLEEKVNGSWRLDGTGDVGRGNRQRAFMSMLAKDAARYMARHPLDTHNVLTAFASAVSIDKGLDLIDIGRKLRPIGEGTAASVTLPVSSDMSSGTFVFRLANEAQPVLAYFAGLGPKPVFADE